MIKGLNKSYSLPQGVKLDDVIDRMLLVKRGDDWCAEIDVQIHGDVMPKGISIVLPAAVVTKLDNFFKHVVSEVKKELSL
jgi:hypothetical protein